VTPPRAVLFDWDNTLVDNWGAIADALNAALTAMGHAPWTLAETRARVRESMRDSFPRMFGERWTEARDIFYRRFAERHLELLRALPDAAETIAALAAAGIYVAVVSNTAGPFLRKEAAQLGWDGLFGRLVGAGDAARDKPAADPVELALAPGGIAPGPGVWFVGDAEIDMECAVQARCIPILIHADDRGPTGFDRFPPRHAVRDFKALRALMGL
jgi:phosphoglycolate phosphatase